MPPRKRRRRQSAEAIDAKTTVPSDVVRFNGTQLQKRERIPENALEVLNALSSKSFRVVLLLPLVIGTLAPIGRVPENFSALSLLGMVIALGLTRWIAIAAGKREKKFVLLWLVAGVVAVVAASAFFPPASRFHILPMLAGVAILFAVTETFHVRGVRSILLFALLVLTLSSLLGAVAVSSQLLSGALVVRALVLGFPTGAILAGSAIALYHARLEEAGWRRSVLLKRKDGTYRKRPGMGTLLYVTLVMLLPASLVMLTPFGLFPPTFMLLSFSVYFSANLCSAYFDATLSGEELARRTVKLGQFTGVVMVVIALFLTV